MYDTTAQVNERLYARMVAIVEVSNATMEQKVDWVAEAALEYVEALRKLKAYSN